MKWRSAWPIFPSPVILPYILKTIWCMNIILWDYESVWPNVWPQNKCRSLTQWSIFHGPVILLYILKTIWYMNTILRNYELWPDVWPQNICRTLWPIFHGPVILPDIFKTIQWLNIILGDYESVWPDIWPQNICRSLWPIFHGPLYLTLLLEDCLNIVLWNYESVWYNIWPQNKCRSLWPIFHGPMILPYILNSVWWMNVIFWNMSQCNMTFDLKINLGHCDLYFTVQWFLIFYFWLWRKDLVLLAKSDSGELRCPATALIALTQLKQTEWAVKINISTNFIVVIETTLHYCA